MEQTLELLFLNEEGKSRKLSIRNPEEGLTEGIIREAMETIINQNMFEQDGVSLYSEVKGARYIARTVTDIFEEA